MNAKSERTAVLLEYLNFANANYRILCHSPCRTSEESAAARTAQGEPFAIGAKALVVKQSQNNSFALLVVPGIKKLDSKKAREILGGFRFATPEELLEVTGGLVPGSVPPFAWPYLPGVTSVYVDSDIKEFEKVGFNAATLEKSIVMSTKEYLRVLGDYRIL